LVKEKEQRFNTA